jgi:chromosome segregation ATPase
MASRIRDFFKPTGAEFILTNDVFLKRKCYRTVWPDPPNLAFLHDLLDEGASRAAEREALETSEALEEIRALDRGGESPVHSRAAEAEGGRPAFADSERRKLMDELTRWRDECILRREEIERMRTELGEMRRRQAGARAQEAEVAESGGKEARELRTLLSQTEERYETLMEEYRQARMIYEEKLTASARENDEEKVRRTETARSLRLLEEAHADLKRQLAAAQGKTKDAETRAAAAEIQTEARAAEAAKAAEEGARRSRELERRVAELESLNKALEVKARDYEIQWGQLQEDYQKKYREVSDRLNAAAQEIGEWKLRAEEMALKVEELRKSRDDLALVAAEQRDMALALGKRNETLEKELAATRADFEMEKGLRQRDEERVRAWEADKRRVEADWDARSRDLAEQKKRVSDLEIVLEERTRALAEMDRSLQNGRTLLESRERELETLRRQVRDMNQQIEQREAQQRRIQIVNQLAERENLFKSLVKRQQKIEAEIREREEAMREILADQERLERDIIEAKQAQRYLMGQARKERGMRVRGAQRADRQSSEADGGRIALDEGDHDRAGVE